MERLKKPAQQQRKGLQYGAKWDQKEAEWGIFRVWFFMIVIVLVKV